VEGPKLPTKASQTQNEQSIDMADFSAQLLDDIDWREKEILDLEQCLLPSGIKSEGALYDSRRKCIWVMLYAHYEGFIKFAFGLYVSEINKLKLSCGNAHPMIATWTMENIFDDMEFGRSKDDFFGKYLPEEITVHRIARRFRVVSELRTLETRIVQIPDSAYSTKSNLNYARLQQLLYQSGFDHNVFSKFDASQGEKQGGRIHRFLKMRHKIAHTARSERIEPNEYEKIRQDIFEIMKELTQLLIKACEVKQYLLLK
jgi:MAE_28990/MAE_18760-like HEPN